MERLDKILAHHGYGTRKDVKKLCHGGVVYLNGKLITDPGTHVDISSDRLEIDGKEIKLQHDIYIMMNKCQDVVCANKDGEHQTVFDLLSPDIRHSFLGGDLHCMGRLDMDTEGLLIITSDGKLSHRLLAPKTHVPKTYAVGLRDALEAKQRDEYIQKFSKGFWIDREQNEAGFECQPSELVFVDSDEKELHALKEDCEDQPSKNIDCLLTIYEGKFHQVKRMFSQLGNEVVYLKRVKMGNLSLDDSIPLGGYRELTEDEVALLSQS